jgi:uncharacterized protein
VQPIPDPRDIVAKVQAIYHEWENRPISRNCTGLAECCRFRLTGRTPFLTRGEAITAAVGWRAAGRTAVTNAPDGSCPFLKMGRCQIYHHRPFGCRTHFCEAAGGPATRKEVRDLIQRLEQLDHELGGDGAVNLPTAVNQAIQQISGGQRRKK